MCLGNEMKKIIPHACLRTGFIICIINFQSKGDQIIYYLGETHYFIHSCKKIIIRSLQLREQQDYDSNSIRNKRRIGKYHTIIN